jgi:tetratricopeptide (TPR) repeat protein
LYWYPRFFSVTYSWQRARRDAELYRAGLQMGVFTRLGSVERDLGRVDQAAAMLENAIAIGKKVDSASLDVQQFQYRAISQLADLYFENGQPERAEPYCKRAINLAEALIHADPNSPRTRRFLASSYGLRASLADSRGNLDQALPDYESAIDIFHELIDSYPDDSRLRYELGILIGAKGHCLQRLQQFARSLECYSAAYGLLRSLVLDNPLVADYEIEFARNEARMAVWNLHQRTADNDVVAKTLLQSAADRLTHLRDSEAAAGRKYDIDVMLSQIKGNNALISRRSESTRN